MTCSQLVPQFARTDGLHVFVFEILIRYENAMRFEVGRVVGVCAEALGSVFPGVFIYKHEQGDVEPLFSENRIFPAAPTSRRTVAFCCPYVL